MDFKVGDKVVCIDIMGLPMGNEAELYKIYTVLDLEPDTDHIKIDNGHAVQLLKRRFIHLKKYEFQKQLQEVLKND